LTEPATDAPRAPAPAPPADPAVRAFAEALARLVAERVLADLEAEQLERGRRDAAA